jgi:hypothetical protein
MTRFFDNLQKPNTITHIARIIELAMAMIFKKLHRKYFNSVYERKIWSAYISVPAHRLRE